MSIKWLFMFGIACFLASTPALSAPAPLIDGMQLHEYCGLVSKSPSELSNVEALHMNECLYFVDGVIEGYVAADTTASMCIPTDEGVTVGQLGLMVFRYTEQHPERLHVSATVIVLETMLNGFHCSTKAPPK
jgi:hypothetical protein